MSRMAKVRGEAKLETGAGRPHSRRRRSTPAPRISGDFVRAFADALRDILNHERPHVA